MKKIINLFLCLILFTACVASEKPHVEQQEAEITTTTTDEQLTGEIEFVNWMVENPTAFEAVVDKFNEEDPGIKINLRTLPETVQGCRWMSIS